MVRLRSRFVAPEYLALGFLLLITSIAYLTANHHELLFDSVMLKAEDLPETVKLIWRAPLRPGHHVSYLTFLLNQRINQAFGLDPFDASSYLIVNVLIHVINAWLVFFLVRDLLQQAHGGQRRSWIPLASAALFAIHPLQASSVAYIYQRRGMLSVLFMLLAVLSYLKLRRPSASEPRSGPQALTRHWPISRVLLVIALPVCFWLSLKSKELGLVLPFLLVATELCLRAPDRAALRRALRWVLPALAASVLILFVFLWSRRLFDPAQFRFLAWGPRGTWGPWTQLLTESRAFMHYWKLLLLPLPQWCCIDHAFSISSNLMQHGAGFAMAFHAALLVLACVAAWKRYTLAAIGICWFYIGLIPYAVVPQVELLVEYETYLSSIGVALLLAEGLMRIERRVSARWLVATVSAAAAVLLVITIQRNVIFQSALNLWSDAVEKSPDSSRAHCNLAEVLARLDRTQEANEHYREAVRLNPGSHEIHLKYGMFLVEHGRQEEALEHYREAVRIMPVWFEAHNGLGALLAASGRIDEAILELKEGLRRKPDAAEGHYNLADALAKRGDNVTAIAHLRIALRLKPQFAQAHNDLGIALAMQGNYQAAISELQEAIRIRPQYPDACFNLGLVLERAGRQEEAAKMYVEVMKLDPTHAAARERLRIMASGAQAQ